MGENSQTDREKPNIKATQLAKAVGLAIKSRMAIFPNGKGWQRLNTSQPFVAQIANRFRIGNPHGSGGAERHHAAMRQVCRLSAPMTPDELLRQVARGFGRQRLRAHLKLRLQGDLYAAKLRKIVQARDGLIILATTKIDDYEPEMLLKAVLGVLPKGLKIEETAALQTTIQYLAFRRLTDNARESIAAILRKANRNGVVTWRKGCLPAFEILKFSTFQELSGKSG